jgi:hypothetical protein
MGLFVIHKYQYKYKTNTFKIHAKYKVDTCILFEYMYFKCIPKTEYILAPSLLYPYREIGKIRCGIDLWANYFFEICTGHKLAKSMWVESAHAPYHKICPGQNLPRKQV